MSNFGSTWPRPGADFVNLHLFVSPEDPKHIEELQRLLSRLQFNVMQDRFDCTRAELIKLGKKADPDITG